MSESRTGGIGFFGLLTIVFITLKLTNYIDWSWWLVLAPLWIPLAIIFAILVIMLVMGARVRQRRKR
jgi:Flp pilus assembly protein TadB